MGSDKQYFNYRFHQSDNPQIIISNDKLARVSDFLVEAINNENENTASKERFAYDETPSKQYKMNMGADSQFTFIVKVVYVYNDSFIQFLYQRDLQLYY